MSRLFTLGGQSTGVSALASILPMNIQGEFPLGNPLEKSHKILLTEITARLA